MVTFCASSPRISWLITYLDEVGTRNFCILMRWLNFLWRKLDRRVMQNDFFLCFASHYARMVKLQWANWELNPCLPLHLLKHLQLNQLIICECLNTHVRKLNTFELIIKSSDGCFASLCTELWRDNSFNLHSNKTFEKTDLTVNYVTNQFFSLNANDIGKHADFQLSRWQGCPCLFVITAHQVENDASEIFVAVTSTILLKNPAGLIPN